MVEFMEARLQILHFILFLCHLDALLRGPMELGGGVSIHDTYVINNVHPILT